MLANEAECGCFTGPTPSTATQVRIRALDEHATLAGWLAEIDWLSRPGGDFTGLVERLLPITESVEAHLRFEQEALCPLLHEVPAWGPEIVLCLEDDHRRQRILLGAVREITSRSASWRELRATARALIDEVALHIAHEHQLLCVDFLRDDIIAIAQEDA